MLILFPPLEFKNTKKNETSNKQIYFKINNIIQKIKPNEYPFILLLALVVAINVKRFCCLNPSKKKRCIDIFYCISMKLCSVLITKERIKINRLSIISKRIY